MAKIIELLTINLAVKNLDEAVGKYRAMGFTPHPPNSMPEPPIQITDVTIPTGASGHLSIIGALGDKSMLNRFLEKRGEGAYSIALRTDDLAGIMTAWRAAGVEWVFPEPYVFPPGTPCVSYVADRFLGNWVKPSSLFGVLLEVFELQGNVRPFPDH